MLFWSIFGLSIGSALLPLINIEILLTGAVSQAPASTWALIGAATVGQMIGKIVWYWGGRQLDRAPFVSKHLEKPKAKASLARWHERAEGRPWFTAGLLLFSAFLGFPPYAITAVLAGVLRVHLAVFLVTGLLGRGLRFWSLVAGTTWLLHLV